MYKVGDRVRVTNLIVNPRSWKVDIGDVFTVNKVDSAGDLYVRSLENQSRLLIESEVEKVEEDKHVYKVGDTIKVTKLITGNDRSWLKIGETHTVIGTRYDGVVYIKLPRDSEYPMLQQQIEKVEEEIKVKEFRVGDKVKVLVEGSYASEAEKGRIYTIETVDYADRTIELKELPAFEQWVYMDDVELVSESSYKVGDKVKVLVKDSCGSGAEKGKVYTIKKLDGKSLRLKEIAHLGGWVPSHHVEHATDQTEFTFPEMAQKLIDGEFEVGTELVADGDSYFVDKVWRGGYGLSTSKSSYEVSVRLGASHMNSKWTVKEESPKEEPIKEMSIEELQKELGYKIKITE